MQIIDIYITMLRSIFFIIIKKNLEIFEEKDRVVKATI